MQHYKVRKTNRNDIPALQGILDATQLFSSSLLPNMIKPFLAGTGKELWLTCLVDDQPVGLAYVAPEEMTEGTWNLLALAVTPHYQAMGLGTALVYATLDALIESRQRLLIVDTSATNMYDGTRRFYAQIGFEEEARIRDFWSNGDDKVTYRKKLL